MNTEGGLVKGSDLLVAALENEGVIESSEFPVRKTSMSLSPSANRRFGSSSPGMSRQQPSRK